MHHHSGSFLQSLHTIRRSRRWVWESNSMVNLTDECAIHSRDKRTVELSAMRKERSDANLCWPTTQSFSCPVVVGESTKNVSKPGNMRRKPWCVVSREENWPLRMLAPCFVPIVTAVRCDGPASIRIVLTRHSCVRENGWMWRLSRSVSLMSLQPKMRGQSWVRTTKTNRISASTGEHGLYWFCKCICLTTLWSQR